MPNPIEQRLASRGAQQQIAVLARSERAAVNVGRVYDRLLRSLLALVGDGGVTDAMARDARDAAQQAASDARAALRADLEATARWSRGATVDAILRTVPLRWFRALVPELAVVPMPEALLTEKLADTPPIAADYEYEPIAQRTISREEAMELIRKLAFKALTPNQVTEYLAGGSGGIAWDERLQYWDSQARDRLLSELVQGVSAGEAVADIRKRLQPITDGIRYKAQRIARTEARRVAERSQVDAYAEMGDMISGMQVIATLDQWTRPEHAARHGKMYRRQADGGFVADDGEVLPDLPDRANCRCYASPLLEPPEEFLKDPALKAEFANAQADVIPDPAAYTQWFAAAGEKERTLAVGVRRYRAMERRLSGTGQRPEWPDFLDAEGRLISPAKITSETPAASAERKQAATDAITRREQLYQQAKAAGMKGIETRSKAPTRRRRPVPA